MWQHSSFCTCCDETACQVLSAVIYISFSFIVYFQHEIHTAIFLPSEKGGKYLSAIWFWVSLDTVGHHKTVVCGRNEAFSLFWSQWPVSASGCLFCMIAVTSDWSQVSGAAKTPGHQIKRQATTKQTVSWEHIVHTLVCLCSAFVTLSADYFAVLV